MLWPDPTFHAEFVRRLNRFTVEVTYKGEMMLAHLANSGRLGELLLPGRQAGIHPAASPGRKTSFDLVWVRNAKGQPISMDARLPNRLFEEAFGRNMMRPFSTYTQLEREVTMGQSRLDFRLSNGDQLCYVEVKSVTLVEDGIALFPDAPTERGVRHVEELIDLRKAGHEAAVVFIIQRNDAVQFRPNWPRDPALAHALIQAQAHGVKIFAYGCSVDEKGIELSEKLPVWLDEAC